MNKFKTFIKENKEIIIAVSAFTIIMLTIAAATAKAIADGDFEDDSIIITTHPDGSFTVSEAPTE